MRFKNRLCMVSEGGPGIRRTVSERFRAETGRVRVTPMRWDGSDIKSGTEQNSASVGRSEEIAAIRLLIAPAVRFMDATTPGVDCGRMEFL